MALFRINAIIAYTDGTKASYTSAHDGVSHSISSNGFLTLEGELFSWPTFRDFITQLEPGIASASDVSHISDIVWFVSLQDNKDVITGFEDSGVVATVSNTTYSSSKFPEFAAVIDRNLAGSTG